MEGFRSHLATRTFLTLLCISSCGASSAMAAQSAQGNSIGQIFSILPISDVGTLFPIIGLIVAISTTQLLRRRKIAQIRSDSSSTP
jgi:hypothetical protein